eukprot:432906_1
MRDDNGNTLFMNAVCDAKGGKIEFIEWILNKCSTNEEKLALIYNHNINKENSLDLAKFTDYQFPLVKTIKEIILSTPKIKNLDMLITPFLWSLKIGRVDFTKWLLSKLNNNSEKRKLINCSNKFGVNSVMKSLQKGRMSSFQFLLSHQLFDVSIIGDKDKDGLFPIHYACFTDTIESISFFKKILEVSSFIGNYSHILVHKDNSGNTAFDYVIKKSGPISYLTKWFLRLEYYKGNNKSKLKLIFNKKKNHEISIIEQFPSFNKFGKIKHIGCWEAEYGKTFKLHNVTSIVMLKKQLLKQKCNVGYFSSCGGNIGEDKCFMKRPRVKGNKFRPPTFKKNETDREEAPVSDTYYPTIHGSKHGYLDNSIYRVELTECNILQCIKQYFQQFNNDIINNDNDDNKDEYDDEFFIGVSLFYLSKHNWSLLKLITSKIKNNKNILSKILNIKNSDNETILYNICKTKDNQYIIKWYLNEIIPINHPILFQIENINGNTVLMLLIKHGLIYLAEIFLNKIQNK